MNKNHKAETLHSTDLISHATVAGAKSTETPADAATSGEILLNALWRSPDKCHLLGVRNPLTGAFQNKSVSSARDAVLRGKAASKNGHDAYFALSEYLTADSRKAENVSGAYGFWLDLDVGESKAAKGLGYATCDLAALALEDFCTAARLPQPTHCVASGGGLHVYWNLDGRIDRGTWQAYARPLKALTQALGFLADPSRTADIASVLRLPGTLNYKYDPPRPVVLIHATPGFIERSVMLEAIDAAHKRLCKVATPTRLACLVTTRPTRSIDHANAANNCPPDLTPLASALAVLDPDCDEPIWALRRLAPMARAARDYPEYHDQLYALARSWSSGELAGIEAQAWITPGNNGRTGEQYFDTVWHRFLTEKHSGRHTTVLRSIYRDAELTGWVAPEDRFELIADAVEVAP